MSKKQVESGWRPRRQTRPAYLIVAAGYSAAGVRQLWQETAFRHVVPALFLCMSLLAVIASSWFEFAIPPLLVFGLVVAEVLRMAVECIDERLAGVRP